MADMQNVIYPVFSKEYPIYLTGIGISEPEYHVERQTGLSSHQFLFTLDGRGELLCGGHCFPQTAGSCFYLEPGVPHRYHPVGTQWKTAWVVFRGNALAEMMQQLRFAPVMSRTLADADAALEIFDRIFSAAQDSVDGSADCSLLLYELILHMHRCFAQAVPSEKNQRRIARDAVSYIDTHYAEDLTLDALAARSGVTVQHFCRCFKAEMHMRPLEYIARRRIARAKQLLTGTEQSIAEISAAVGYSGATYFGMVFRKYENMSPGAFRRSCSPYAP